MNQLRNQEILDKVAAKAELKKPLKDIFQAWENLYQITLNLVNYMGDIVPAKSGKPLLEVCLANAVNAFHDVSATEFGTAAQMVAYIRGLLKETPSVVHSSLGTTGDDPVLWEPFLQPISTFQDTYPNLIKIYEDPYADVKDNSVRLMILARIINVRDLYWIDRYDSLPTILDAAA